MITRVRLYDQITDLRFLTNGESREVHKGGEITLNWADESGKTEKRTIQVSRARALQAKEQGR